MHSALRELADLLAQDRRALLDVWASIPPADRTRRPKGEGWSPAEVMEHLRLVEGGSARLLARRLERAREAGLGAEQDHSSRLGGLARYNLPDNPARLIAPDAVLPTAPLEDAEAALAETRAAVDALMRDADGLALGEVRATHMRFGDIDLYQWLEFIALHERRHTRQLVRLRERLEREREERGRGERVDNGGDGEGVG